MVMHGPQSHPEDRYGAVLRVLLIEGCANVFILSAKLVAGIATGSFAILGDALHSLSDAANNVVGWFVVRHSSQPADADHPYGHRKFETLAVFVLATLLTVLAFEIAIRALTGAAEHEVRTGGWELIVMVGALTINVGVAFWEWRMSKRLHSEILGADAKHTLSDSLTTLAVIVGWQFAARGYPWMDTLAAVLVALIVLWLAYGLFKRAVPILVDQVALDPAEVKAALLEMEEVQGVREVRSRWVGRRPHVDVVIQVAGGMDIQAAHEIAHLVEHRLEARYAAADTTVHVEPLGAHGTTP
jgi:cation diffusion facilitator family transporter